MTPGVREQADRHVARLVVRDAWNETYFYDHEVLEMERLGRLSIPEASDGNVAGSTLGTPRATQKLLADILAFKPSSVTAPYGDVRTQRTVAG